MTLEETMAELEAMGTEQNRKIYRRHGVGGPQFGVSVANLKALKKRIKIDQRLAEELWLTGNYDARYLATMIADPRRISEEVVDTWLHDLDNYAETDAVVALVAQSPHARPKMERWIQSGHELTGRAGWHLLGQLAAREPNLPDDYFRPYLERIEREIHSRPNRLRQAMNNAVIAIGARNETLREEALRTAAAVGAVYVDHGETGCKTPDAAAYIVKTFARRQAKQKV